MKLCFLCLTLVLLSFLSTAQQPASRQPFIISGKLLNLAKKQLIFFYRDIKKDYKDFTIDTIQAGEDGKFYLQAFDMATPTLATLRGEGLSLDLYAAPGYNLQLQADAKDMKTFRQTSRVTGAGYNSNRYLQLLDSILVAREPAKGWYEMNEPELLGYVRKDKLLKDSLYQVAFGKKDPTDEWQSYFAKLTKIESQSLTLYYLMSYSLFDTTFTYKKSMEFARAHFDKTMIATIFNEEYLISGNYFSWLMGTYSQYLRQLDSRRDPSYKKQKSEELQVLDKIAGVYKGKIRELKLAGKMRQAITYSRTIEELNRYKRDYPAYISTLPKPDRVSIDSLLSATEVSLFITQTGKEAPAFSTEDSAGRVYNLGNYKGKVVYLDLWASWCAPCRYETPFIKSLVDKYKNDSSIVFISIAVLDKYKNWKEALSADKPTWLQLYDKKSEVQNAYIATSIPKFILIDKKGNIVSFDAPFPSTGVTLEKLLNEEITR